MASKHVCLQARKLNSTLQRNTFYSGGQNPCLTYWEIGGNVCPVNIGDGGAAMGEIQGGDPTARIALFSTAPNANALFSKASKELGLSFGATKFVMHF